MTTLSPLADLLAIELDDRVKGLPPGIAPFPLGAIGKPLAEASRAAGLERPIKLLLEGGYVGGRTGARTLADGLAVARAVAAEAPRLALVGVEGFEGIIVGSDAEDTERKIAAFLDFLVELARGALAENLFVDGPLLLSAGGSAFYDMVVERFAAAGLGRPVEILIRSGCYLTHDSIAYRDAFRRLLDRSAMARRLGDGLKPALELWAYVQSRPEPTRAI